MDSRPHDSSSTPGAVEPRATPRRHSGPEPAQPQPTARKRSTDSVGGPSRNFEVNVPFSVLSALTNHQPAKGNGVERRTAWRSRCTFVLRRWLQEARLLKPH